MAYWEVLGWGLLGYLGSAVVIIALYLWACGLDGRGGSSYPEDAHLENICTDCNILFIGYKRRQVCRRCNRGVSASDSPAPHDPTLGR